MKQKDYTYQKGFNSSKTNTKPRANHKTSHNPSPADSRKGAKAPRQKTSGDGLMARAVGVRVPMRMFDEQYTKPNIHAQVGIGETGPQQMASAKKTLNNKSQRAQFKR